MPENHTSKIIDAYNGMITRAQAQKLGAEHIADQGSKHDSDITTAAAFLAFANAKGQHAAGMLFPAGRGGNAYVVSMQDRLYRIFNPVISMYGQKQQERRTVVIGIEGSTIRLMLRDRLSQFIDANVFERGDLVLIRNASYDGISGDLVGVQNTVISKIMPSHDSSIVDYSRLHEGMKNIDIIGKVVEIGPIRYVNRLSGTGQIAVADCIISDIESSIGISMWGSSALATSRLNVNDFIKVEFCSTVLKNGAIALYANEFSRVVASKIFEGRLLPSMKQ